MPAIEVQVKEKYRVIGRIKRMGGSSSGTTATPRGKRRTVTHQKGVAFPGQWPAPTDKRERRGNAR